MCVCEDFQDSLLKELSYITYSSVNCAHRIVPVPLVLYLLTGGLALHCFQPAPPLPTRPASCKHKTDLSVSLLVCLFWSTTDLPLFPLDNTVIFLYISKWSPRYVWSPYVTLPHTSPSRDSHAYCLYSPHCTFHTHDACVLQLAFHSSFFPSPVSLLPSGSHMPPCSFFISALWTCAALGNCMKQLILFPSSSFSCGLPWWLRQ